VSADPLRVLYVVYWGAAEPLGQSLVVPAVKRLAQLGVRLSLMTFEKGADAWDRGRMAAIRSDLLERGVDWIALRYHRRPNLPAKAFDTAHGLARGLAAAGRPFHLVHARTFMGGVMGLPLARALRARLVYHNEGFYPDEQVDGGFWTRGSGLHRAAKAIEEALYARSDGLIVLSRRAAESVAARPRVAARGTPIEVVPSCVDLRRFAPGERPGRDGPLRFVYTGAVGGRYLLDRVARFLAVAGEVLGPLRLKVLTPADPGLVTSLLERGGLAREAWSLDRLPHDAMPAELSRHDSGLFFLTQGLSEQGCSPTKIGEYWACGLPVVTTANVSDTDAIVRSERVGVVLAGHADADYRSAARELAELLRDPGLPARCRRAAEAHYALEPACDRQAALYQRVAAGSPTR
jgi:glycosyltransferase involved in cell wall biosynthesis